MDHGGFWTVLDSAGCVLDSVYASRWVATGAPGSIAAATVISAHAVLDAVLANYVDDDRNSAAVPLESRVVRRHTYR